VNGDQAAPHAGPLTQFLQRGVGLLADLLSQLL
jgi:hypothetical protein